MPTYPSSRAGYTLIELLVVVGILAIISTIILTNTNSKNHEARLDAAGTELINAVRQAQARSESDKVYTALRIQETTSIEVLEVDDTATPPEPSTTQIIHPLSKRPYRILLSERPATAGIAMDISNGPFVHSDSSTTEFLFFDPQGRPYVVGNSGTGLLAATNISVSIGGVSRTLDIDNLSGRARMVP